MGFEQRMSESLFFGNKACPITALVRGAFCLRRRQIDRRCVGYTQPAFHLTTWAAAKDRGV
jgi:hypothetical protein